MEWYYKDLKQYFSSRDYKRGLKLRQSPISFMYKAAALFLNFKACLDHGGKVQSYFKFKPPTLEEYDEVARAMHVYSVTFPQDTTGVGEHIQPWHRVQCVCV